MEDIELHLYTTVDYLYSKLGLDFNKLELLFQYESAPEDVEVEYKLHGVRTMNLKIFDTKYLAEGVAFMRPYIRGFLVLLLMFFVWRQVMSLIGQDPGVLHHAQQNYEKWRDKEE